MIPLDSDDDLDNDQLEGKALVACCANKRLTEVDDCTVSLLDSPEPPNKSASKQQPSQKNLNNDSQSSASGSDASNDEADGSDDAGKTEESDEELKRLEDNESALRAKFDAEVCKQLAVRRLLTCASFSPLCVALALALVLPHGPPPSCTPSSP